MANFSVRKPGLPEGALSSIRRLAIRFFIRSKSGRNITSLYKGNAVSFTELVKHNECWRDVVAGRPRQWKKGYKFADDTARMYFLVSGRVRLVALAADGGEKTLWYLGDGCCFNETPLFEDNQEKNLIRTGDARFYHECMENCYLHTFTMQDVKMLGKERPELLLNLCQSYATKVTLLSQHLVSLSLESQLTRVCKYLASRLVPGSVPLPARRDLSYREMADLLGMHRISLYKVMRQAQDQGLWDFDKNSDEIVILQPAVFFEEAHTMPPLA